jgi:hypothetical protein
LYALPVCLAGWYSGAWTAVAFAVVILLGRVVIMVEGSAQMLWSAELAMNLARGVVIVFGGLWFARLADLERALETRVHVLEGLLPICAHCKSIRNDHGSWERLEQYISERSAAQFSHSVCPNCRDIHYAELTS